MAKPSNLPDDLVDCILSRVPLTSLTKVRSTCKRWNALSKTRIFGFILMNSRIFSMNFDLQGVRNDMKFVNPSIKKVSILAQDNISQVSHCDGLLLCVAEANTKLIVWNPYLGQIKWIKPVKRCYQYDDKYVLGYDNNRNHKILNLFDGYDNNLSFELYDFNSSSWRVVDINPLFDMELYRCGGVSLKGNTYFFAWNLKEGKFSLFCFDFTTESFGPCLPLPFDDYHTIMSLSCVREEQLAFFYQHWSTTMEIHVTDKIEPNAVSWSKFLRVETNGLPRLFGVGSFFIDVEKKVVVVVNELYVDDAYIIGEDGYSKTVKIKEAGRVSKSSGPPVFSSYVPSLVQLQINNNRKRKERDC